MCEQRGPHACANKGATHEQRWVRGHLLEDIGRLVVSAWLELEPDAVGQDRYEVWVGGSEDDSVVLYASSNKV